MSEQTDLFGAPPLRAESSQWWTPQKLARRLAAWVPPGARVLEPSCGSGNLIAALLERGHDPSLIHGIELDKQWADHARGRFDGKVEILHDDFLRYRGWGADYDVCLTNPPFENALHASFLEGALDMGIPLVLGVFPSSIEFGLERDQLWRTKAQVVRRARLPQRVSYGGSFSASFDTVCLAVKRRCEPRGVDEVSQVSEEIWLLS